MGLVGIPFNGLPLIWRTDANLLSWEINSQVLLLFVMVFPRGPYLAPCYLSSSSFINDLPLYVTSSRIDLYADDTTLTSSTNYSSIGRLEGTLSTSIAEIVDWAASKSINSASINCFFGPTTASKFHLMQQLEWLLLVYYLTMTRARRRHHVFLHWHSTH